MRTVHARLLHDIPGTSRSAKAPRPQWTATVLVGSLLAAAIFVCSQLVEAQSLFADIGHRAANSGPIRLLKTIPVPGAALYGFDISWVDSTTQRYYLADRSNKAIDVVDAR